MMKKIMTSILVVAALFGAVGCTPKYNVEESTQLVNAANTDSILTQETYGKMIDMLDKGYSYMRGRLAGAAFEKNPSEALNDIINFMGDSTLNAVQHHSGVLIEALEKAPLDKKNARRFEKVRAQYRELEESLLFDTPADSTASVSHE